MARMKKTVATKKTKASRKVIIKSNKRRLIFGALAVFLVLIFGYSIWSIYISPGANAAGNNWTPVRFNNATVKVCVYQSSTSNRPHIRLKVYNPSPQVRWAQLIVNKAGPGQHQYDQIQPADFNKVKDYLDHSGRDHSLPGGDPRTFYFKVNIGTDTRTQSLNYSDINKCDLPTSVPYGANWDRVAQCESGGNWEANTGNNYYGGLQFSMSTWRSYGGEGRPDHNSRAEQIRVAERLRSAHPSLSDWPHCGYRWWN